MVNLYDLDSLKNLSAEDTYSSFYKAALLYGQNKDESIDYALFWLYENLNQYCTESQRYSLYRSVYSEVYSGETGSDALKPFICLERRSNLIVSTACLDYSITNLVGNDEFGAADGGKAGWERDNASETNSNEAEVFRRSPRFLSLHPRRHTNLRHLHSGRPKPTPEAG